MKNTIKARKPKAEKPEVVVPDLKPLNIAKIAKTIVKDWGTVNYAAKPYLQAMNDLNGLDDNYGLDSGASIVRYFLSNASTYRGKMAKAIKEELRRRLKEYDDGIKTNR